VWGREAPLGEVEQTELREAVLSHVALAASVFHERVRTREARIGIIGLGYAGLPLALAFARQGFEVTGIDLNRP
jgi:2-polyprenyl-3-methyl-5-hydroxy-6-metoxy-1,4-benzoquinol methylase